MSAANKIFWVAIRERNRLWIVSIPRIRGGGLHQTKRMLVVATIESWTMQTQL
jgi:hypothetical protein